MQESFEREVIGKLSRLEANQINIKQAVDRSAEHIEKCVTMEMCNQTRQVMEKLLKKNGNGSSVVTTSSSSSSVPTKLYWWALGIMATLCTCLIGIFAKYMGSGD